jgi:hypothetical protein
MKKKVACATISDSKRCQAGKKTTLKRRKHPRKVVDRRKTISTAREKEIRKKQ